MKISKIIIFSTIFMLFFSSFFILYLNRINNSLEEENKYFDQFDLTFSGIVIDKHHISNGAGIVDLDIKSSTVKNYDVREKFTSYFCVIEEKKAEVVMNSLFLINIGDSLVIDSNIRKINLYRDQILKESWDFQLPTNATFFYTFARWKHKL